MLDERYPASPGPIPQDRSGTDAPLGSPAGSLPGVSGTRSGCGEGLNDVIDSVGNAQATGCFLSRELSWLQFNLRVLHQAADPGVPLLERLKFLSIYYSNLDEFFMVRVGSLTHRSLYFPDETDRKTGWTAATELKKVLRAAADHQQTAERIWQDLQEDLKARGIEVVSFRHTGKAEETILKKLFAELRPLLEPRVVDNRHPMPFLGNCESYMCVLLDRGEKSILGLVPLYRVPRFHIFESDGVQKVVIVSQLVEHYAGQLFRKQTVRESCILRVTRNADVFFDDLQEDEDYRSSMKELLRKRKREQPVRLQLTGRPSRQLQEMLAKELKLSERSVFLSKVPFDLGFGGLVTVTPEMKYAPRRSVRTVELHKGQYFPYLEQQDLLLSFPYQSITPFIELLYEAADDPEVLSIRITLYRLAASSKLAAALAYAADRGKDVLCLLELRARFDEQNNIDYSEVLEDAGCSVIYGLPRQKVHSKLCLITRRSGEKICHITQVGTGNYNEVTSEQYCDLSLITADPLIGQDAAAVFDALALGETPGLTQKLWVAPEGYKTRLLDLLDRELQKGSAGSVCLKVNSLNDLDVMDRLIRCSQAGVKVELFVRGICCLRPGIPGWTENITVKSVVGRHLEHSRIFVFGTGEAQRIFIGSGDLLNRNTQRRVEAFIEVSTPETRTQVLEVMKAFRQDDTRGWVMLPDGTYRQPMGTGTDSQDRLYAYFSALRVTPPEPPALPAPPEPPAPKKRLSLWKRLFARRRT